VAFPLGPRISVTPSASYSQFTIDDGEGDGGEVDISSVKIAIGLNIRI